MIEGWQALQGRGGSRRRWPSSSLEFDKRGRQGHRGSASTPLDVPHEVGGRHPGDAEAPTLNYPAPRAMPDRTVAAAYGMIRSERERHG